MPQKKKYFNNIDELPLKYWWEIQDNSNFIYLVKGSDHSETDHTEEAMEVYKKLNNQIISKYGVSDSYMKILKKKRQYLILMNDGLAKEDGYTQQRAEHIKREIDNIAKEETPYRREHNLVIIHTFVGGKMINPLEMTVDQYYYHMEYIDIKMKEEEMQRQRMKTKSKK